MTVERVTEPETLPPVCILAGGVGSRLGEQVESVPKPLLEVAGEPFLMHQLRLLAQYGARNVVMCVGYLGDVIERVIGPERFGIHVAYSHDGPGLDGTLGAIHRAAEQLPPRFLVLYGDTYLRIDYRAAADSWKRSGLPAMMTVLRNEGRWDVSNAHFDGTRVISYDKHAPSANMSWIDYGLGGLTDAALELLGEDASDLSDLYRVLAIREELFGFEAVERFYEIGTPGALTETDAFLRSLIADKKPDDAHLADEPFG
jgi:NDP-sugar pyrophosphorylase family protein